MLVGIVRGIDRTGLDEKSGDGEHPEQHDWVTDAVGPSQASAERANDCLISGGTGGEDDVVEEAHDGGLVLGALGEREGVVGKGLATVDRAAVGEFLTQDGGHVRPVGVGRGADRELSENLDLVAAPSSAARTVLGYGLTGLLTLVVVPCRRGGRRGVVLFFVRRAARLTRRR